MAAEVDLGTRRYKCVTASKKRRMGLGLVGTLAALVGGPVLTSVSPLLGGAATLAGLAATIALVLVVVRAYAWRQGSVRVDARGVHFPDGSVDRAAIQSAFHLPTRSDRKGTFELRGSAGGWLGSIKMDDPREASASLEALGVSTDAAAQFAAVAPRWMAASWVLLATMLLAMVGLGVSLALGAPVVGGLAFAVALAAPFVLVGAVVRVGADGLGVSTRLAKRFFAWSDVRDVTASGVAVVVHTAQGDFAIPIATKVVLSPAEQETQAILVDRARHALAVYRARGASTPAERLARNGRSVEAWLRALDDGEGDFRRLPVSSDDLLRLVEDPLQSASLRAAAATALRKRANPDERVRIKTAADACAAHKLRVVLEHAADDADDDAVREALAVIEEEEARLLSRSGLGTPGG